MVGKVIDSVFSQGYKGDFEVIVAGMDEHNLIKPRKGLNFIRTSTRKNPAEARNICLKKAKGETMVLIDADCIPGKDWLSGLIDSPNEIVMGAVDFSSENFWTFCDNFVHFHGTHFTKPAREESVLSTYNVKVPKAVFDDVGLFNEGLETGEDDEFFLRAKRKGYELYFDPKPIVNHLPNRKTFVSVLGHSRYWGEDAIKLRSKFPETNVPGLFHNRYVLLAASPLIAAFVTLRIYLHLPFLRYIYLLPIVYLCKMAWIYGSFKGQGAKHA